MKKFFKHLVLDIVALGAIGFAAVMAVAAPGAQTLTTLSGSYLLPVDAGAVSAQTSLTTLGSWVASSGFTGAVTVGGYLTLGTAGTCSGTTTATCTGQRFTVSTTGLTTAAGGASSAAMVVTNASVASSATLVHCQVNGYSGTGTPIATAIVPGTGQVSVSVTNVAASGSLNATVPIACVAF